MRNRALMEEEIEAPLRAMIADSHAPSVRYEDRPNLDACQLAPSTPDPAPRRHARQSNPKPRSNLHGKRPFVPVRELVKNRKPPPPPSDRVTRSSPAKAPQQKPAASRKEAPSKASNSDVPIPAFNMNDEMLGEAGTPARSKSVPSSPGLVASRRSGRVTKLPVHADGSVASLPKVGRTRTTKKSQSLRIEVSVPESESPPGPNEVNG